MEPLEENDLMVYLRGGHIVQRPKDLPQEFATLALAARVNQDASGVTRRGHEAAILILTKSDGFVANNRSSP